jgi:hypothetical protein
MPTSIRWALPTLQLLNLFLKTDSNRIPYDLYLTRCPLGCSPAADEKGTAIVFHNGTS